MGWKDWRAEDVETTETLTQTVHAMHDDEARDPGPLPGTEND